MERKKKSEQLFPAVLALLAAVFIGFFGIGGIKAKMLAQKPQKMYLSEMQADFSAREAAAKTLIALAENAVSIDLVNSAKQALETSVQAKTPAEKYRAGNEMKIAVELVYQALPKHQRDQKGSPEQMAWSEFTSRTAILSHSIPKYNQLAERVKNSLSTFPATILVGEISVEEMQGA